MTKIILMTVMTLNWKKSFSVVNSKSKKEKKKKMNKLKRKMRNSLAKKISKKKLRM
jgi:hypothetical protein